MFHWDSELIEHWCMNIIKMDLQELGYKDADWIQLAQDTTQW
jgi:hypothetical protein